MLDQWTEPEREPPPIPRLGETAEFRSLLFRLLELDGWTVDVLAAVGGTIVIAHRPGLVVERHGLSAADVAVDVFRLAQRLRGRE